MAQNIFNGCPNVLIIYCYSNSTAEAYAKANNIDYKLIDQQDNSTTPAKKGTKFTVNKNTYTVTNATVGKAAVTFTGTTNKKATKLTIPATVKYTGVTYKVTGISAKALKGNKKLTSVTVGSNVSTIGNSAFENCTKLKKITLGKSVTKVGKNTFKNCKKLTNITIKSTKLKSVGKNALKGISSKCKIKVPSKKLKAYKKLFKGKGQESSVKITK